MPSELGWGKDGTVFSTRNHDVIKVYVSEGRFNKALRVYQRFESRGVTSVLGHNVPVLKSYDENLLAIAMTHVVRPWLSILLLRPSIFRRLPMRKSSR